MGLCLLVTRWLCTSRHHTFLPLEKKTQIPSSCIPWSSLFGVKALPSNSPLTSSWPQGHMATSDRKVSRKIKCFIFQAWQKNNGKSKSEEMQRAGKNFSVAHPECLPWPSPSTGRLHAEPGSATSSPKHSAEWGAGPSH